MIFNISPLFALLPLVLYIILAFKDINPVLNVVICVVLAALLTNYPIPQMGSLLGEALGSFLGLIGLIIMLGSALGAVLQKTGVAQVYLALLDSKGILANAQQIVNQFENTYKAHRSIVSSGHFPGQNGINYYKDDVYIGADATYMTPEYRAQWITLLDTARDNALNDYMMIWLVKLVRLQVLLNSYL